MKKAPFLFGFLLVLALFVTGCKQPVTNLIEMDPLIYSIELSVNSPIEQAVFRDRATDTLLTGPLEITVTNRGNQQLSGLQIQKRGTEAADFDIDISALSAASLAPGESTVFTINLLRTLLPAAFEKVHNAEILVGNDYANKILALKFTGYTVEALAGGETITLSPAILQFGEPGSAVTTTIPSPGEWVSSNPAVAFFDTGNNLIASGFGETFIYFSTGTYTVKGIKVTVYPAVETLNPQYPEEDGFVTGVNAGIVLPVNLEAIINAAGEDGDIAFTLTGGKTGGNVAIINIGPDSGALTFSGSVGDEAETATVTLAITMVVPEGILTAYQGSVTFKAKIVPSKPGPEIQSTVIDGAVRADAKKLVITYDKPPMLTSLAGFSIGNATQGNFVFSGYGVSENNLTITLGREPAWSEIQANNLTLTYNNGTGNVQDKDGNKEITANALPITIQNFDPSDYQPPVVAKPEGNPNIIVDGQAPTSLVITWSKALDASSGFAGFALSGAGSAVSFTGSSVNGAVQTLTMNRAIVQSETSGLTLTYNASNSAPVKDTDGSAAEGFAGKAVTIVNSADFGAPPALSAAAIDTFSPRDLALTFDQAVQASSAAGFSVTGSATGTTITAVSGAGTNTLTLTLNRKPAHGETILLSYNAASGNVASDANPTLLLGDFTNTTVTLTGFTQQDDTRPELVSVVIDAARAGAASSGEAKVIHVTFDKAVTATNIGFTVSNSVTAETVKGIAGSGTTVLKLILNDWPSLSEASAFPAFTLTYDMDLGNAGDSNDNLVLSFSQAVTLQNFAGLPNGGVNIDTAPPRMVSATVENSTPSTVRVVFNEPVTIDAPKFYVKVNDVPYKSMAATPPASGILLDLQKRADRTITGVSVVPGTNDTTWNMTMSAPAVHGEILRLATSAVGAAQDKATDISNLPAPNSLPEIPQFIVKNEVRRVREIFESVAGLYVNGNKIASVTDGAGGLLYQNALAYLHNSSSGHIPTGNDIITIVLDTNQTFTQAPSWWPYNGATGIPESTSNQLPIKIIVTTTGNTVTISNKQTAQAMFQGRNGIILVIDEGVIFKGSSLYPTKGSLIQMMTGGSIILDGGEIRDHLSLKDGGTGNEQNDLHAGGIRFGGGANGGYLIINSGKITNNTARFNTGGGPGATAQGSAGGVIVLQYGVIVMTGGEISGNTLDVQGAAPTSALAGGIMGNTNTAQRHGNFSFFMTGGEISGNKVINSTAQVASAGGVMVSGNFQKNGGTIFGGDAGDTTKRNTTTLTGNKAGAVFVSNAAGSNPASAFKRDETTTPNITLFVESLKPNTSSLAVNTVPLWAASFWDE
jgi:hypothetical protein